MVELEHVETAPAGERGNATELLRRRSESGEPVRLTLDGEADLVVRDAGSRQLLFDLVNRLETIAAIQDGLDEADRGEGRPAAQVLAEIRARGVTHG